MSRGFAVLIILSALSAGLLLTASRRALAEEGKPKSELSKCMVQIDDGMKKLHRSLRTKDKNDVSLDTIAKIEAAAVAAKEMTPQRATTMPSDKQPAYVTEYRKQMTALIVQMCNMETALLDGDNAKAQDIYQKLKQQEEDGHDQFMADDSDSTTQPQK